MSDEIINRVAQSKLMTIDLEDFYPEGERIIFDISSWLYEGLILREKDFREKVKRHDWLQYQDAYMALTCTTDAIIPSWAYLLITAYVAPYAKKIVVGNEDLLETLIFQDIINDIDVSIYKGKPVIIKGCADKPIPPSAFVLLAKKLHPVVQSFMFGEACSTVPLYKARN